MRIATHPIVSDSATWRNLPDTWTTLRELSQLAEPALRYALTQGKVHANMTGEEAKALRQELTPATPQEPTTARAATKRQAAAVDALGTRQAPIAPTNRTTVEKAHELTLEIDGLFHQATSAQRQKIRDNITELLDRLDRGKMTGTQIVDHAEWGAQAMLNALSIAETQRWKAEVRSVAEKLLADVYQRWDECEHQLGWPARHRMWVRADEADRQADGIKPPATHPHEGA